MADFTSNFWPWFIGITTIISFIAVLALIRWMTEPGKTDDDPQTMGHTWDGDLAEYNNPLPSWWLKLFYITIFFGIGYLALYPGLGFYQGLLGWTEIKEYESEVATADKQFAPLYDRYQNQELATLATDTEAMKTGSRLFANYCSSCHGSDARGAKGFPNLRDDDWLYGGDPNTIKATILNGRSAAMPPWGAVLGEEGVHNVTQYVISLSGGKADATAASAGGEKYKQLCFACHGVDGKGNQALGAPNLTDKVWLYGGLPTQISKSIATGRNGHMPAHKDFLGEAKVHLLAAYIFSLSNEK
ncbi:MAG: cytochrome-c oxidase, cbb3-type subunit III [Gammaproteobacteria bacterium]|nr:cytochrome-c oxidase, cbb3-type subunit III [Gammaproteobacteria bacterium]